MTEISTKESPFTPGRPVQPEYFVARLKEIRRLDRAIRQTVSGRNENVFITGQRGIGKSSLAGFVRHLAEKEYGLIGSHCFLGGVTSLEEMVRVIFQKLLQDCTDKSLFDKFRESLAPYVKELKLFGIGVEFTKNKNELRNLVDNFLPVMRDIYEQIESSGRKGLILILDDLNGIAGLKEFSQFLKSFVDELATSGKSLPILLVLVGLDERKDQLVENHPSVARIFDIVDLPPMTESESKDFFLTMFAKQGISVEKTALAKMVSLSGDFPMLLHEVGDAVFWQDTDDHISDSDATKGITEAAQIVGKKYIGKQVGSVFRNKTYSSILLRMGKKLPIGATFKRRELLKTNAPENEGKNLDNFLSKIKKLGIMKDGEARGEYTFVNPLYHLYIWYEAKSRNR